MLIDERDANYRIEGRNFNCSIDVTMFFMGGRWKMVLLWYIMSKPRGFDDIKKRIPNINDKMLSIQLKALESDGFLKMEDSGEEEEKYYLTEKGNSLIPLLRELDAWGVMMAKEHGELVFVDE